jgi:hypothetical protein
MCAGQLYLPVVPRSQSADGVPARLLQNQGTDPDAVVRAIIERRHNND